MFGGSTQLPTSAEHCFVVWTALKDLITAHSAVVGSWEEPPNIWLTVVKNDSVDWAMGKLVKDKIFTIVLLQTNLLVWWFPCSAWSHRISLVAIHQITCWCSRWNFVCLCMVHWWVFLQRIIESTRHNSSLIPSLLQITDCKYRVFLPSHFNTLSSISNIKVHLITQNQMRHISVYTIISTLPLIHNVDVPKLAFQFNADVNWLPGSTSPYGYSKRLVL